MEKDSNKFSSKSHQDLNLPVTQKNNMEKQTNIKKQRNNAKLRNSDKLLSVSHKMTFTFLSLSYIKVNSDI